MSKNRYDIVIIGSGLTGSITADYLSRNGCTVAVIERGGYYRPTPRDHWTERWGRKNEGKVFGNMVPFDLERTEVVNTGKDPFVYNMKFGVGGSGAVWSGQALRFTESDFQTKTKYGHGFDWPISYDELEPFYVKAEEELGVSGPSNVDLWSRSKPYPMPPFKMSYLDHCIQRAFGNNMLFIPIPVAVCSIPYRGRYPCIGANSCVSFCPSSARYRSDQVHLRKALKRRCCRIYTHSYVIKLATKGNKIDHCIVMREGGKSCKIYGELFFLCANAIENTRILLSSANDRYPCGLANSSGLVGKYFMSQGGITFLVTLHEPVYPFRGRPITSFGIDFVDGPFRKYHGAYMVEVWNRTYNLGTIKNYLHKLVDKGAWGDWLVDEVKKWKASVRISVPFETIPSRHRIVTVSKQFRDKFGYPLPEVRFTFNKFERRTMKVIEEFIRKNLKCKQISVTGYGINGNHPLGICRMGSSKETGVVDDFMRSFDHPNLFVYGGASFVTSSPFNPSLTIAALTLRSLEEIKLRFF